MTGSLAWLAAGLVVAGSASSQGATRVTGSVPRAATTTIAVTVAPADVTRAVVAAADASAPAGSAHGGPVCPAAIRTRVGLVLQCVVPFGPTQVPFLAEIGSTGAVRARPTFPIVAVSKAAALAGPGFRCGEPRASVIVAPPASRVRCSSGTRVVELFVADASGSLRRVDPTTTTKS